MSANVYDTPTHRHLGWLKTVTTRSNGPRTALNEAFVDPTPAP